MPVGDHLHGRLNLEFAKLGALKLKNIARPVEAFAVQLTDAKAARVAKLTLPDHASQLSSPEAVKRYVAAGNWLGVRFAT
jgi:hypothetical protein